MHPRRRDVFGLSPSPYRRLAGALVAVALGGGCGGSTPAAQDPAASREVAEVDLSKPPAPAPPEKSAAPAAPAEQTAEGEGQAGGEAGEAKDEGKENGRNDVLGSSSADDPSAPTSMMGNDMGDSYLQGGLGLTGVGGSGGSGEGLGIGTGRSGAYAQAANGAKPPSIRLGKLAIQGTLPPEVIQRILRQNFGRFRLCYEKGLQKDPRLKGSLSVRLTIHSDGALFKVTTLDSNLPDPEVESCVVQSLYKLTFPKPESGIVFVTTPFTFEPGSPPPATTDAKKAPAPAPAAAAAPKASAMKPAAPAKQP